MSEMIGLEEIRGTEAYVMTPEGELHKLGRVDRSDFTEATLINDSSLEIRIRNPRACRKPTLTDCYKTHVHGIDMGETIAPSRGFTGELILPNVTMSVDKFNEETNLPERYIINEHVCVCHWEDGTTTKSFKHNDDVFNKKLGFLLCCFRHYNKNMSKNKQKKLISWIKYECLEDYLFDIFVSKTGMTVRQAKAYLRDLKVEETKNKPTKSNKKEHKPKHMKGDSNYDFKVGDRVISEEFGEGTIIVKDGEYFLVEFDKEEKCLHSGNEKGKENRCWWYNIEKIKKKENEKWIIQE